MDSNSLGDLGTLISKLSENPEALNAVGSLMGMFSQTKKEPEPPKSGIDTDKLLSMLSSLGGESQKCPESNGLTRIFGTKEEIRNRIALLNAVKPYLSTERRDKLENVIKLLKLTELGELSGLLNKV